ncbi:LytR/AlgR family response regulator transcription factor [Thomasclavelia cocleata]|uniref:LytR/AlgR family response regulator transcription factor n=1 Tax=Thomasclavelia cocleata TaxID=69824 RepID=UPI00242DDACA|nr:LytTR family DNA-binding domain-containing protein [Thomasclavelia cocleata]
MYNVAIIDDETEILEIIYNKIKHIFNNEGITPIFTCLNNPQQLEMNKYYDILFLDIDMPSIDGINLAQTYLQKHNNTIIIFITNKYDLVFNAFSVHPYDFIKKEDLDVGLIQPIKHLISKLNKENKIISIRDKNNIININCKDIVYCESYGHKCYIHTINNTIETTKYKLSNIESIINSPDFYMINQSYLVHWKYVTQIENKNVIIKNKTNLLISKRRLKESLASYQKYIMRNL